MKIRPLFLLTAAAYCLLPKASYADAQGNLTRALVNKYAASVVTLRLVLKSAGGSGDQAQLEAQGVVIDPSGIVATTNTAIDPYSMMSGLAGGHQTAIGR